MSHISVNKGFTLMELLIVIGVLGILAAGLLAAIDPFEQLKKARDTNNRSAAIELLQSNQRYYANHGDLPWQTTLATCTTTVDEFDPLRASETDFPHAVVQVAADTSSQYVANVNTCITDSLVADGELKTSFFEGLKTTLYLGSGSKTKVVVCFAPEGKSNLNDSASKYVIDAGFTTVTEVACTQADKDAGLCLQCFE